MPKGQKMPIGAPAIMTLRPFADAALDLAERGVAVIPCPGNDGKSPAGAIRGFGRWRRPPGAEAVRQMAEKWGEANIGIITSLSRVTIADVDGDDRLAEHMIRRAGETPLITRTPSGGCHLWYRSNGERNANLRSSGLSVDVKGAAAGIVIVPPSFRPSTATPYTFAMGSWDELARLPCARPGSLSVNGLDRTGIGQVATGRRNDALLRYALRQARHCDDLDALVDVVSTANDGLAEPLNRKEVTKIAMNAWKYETEGRNWIGCDAKAVLTPSVIDRLSNFHNGPDALMLHAKLLVAHGARTERGEAFAIAPAAMVEAGTIGRWGARRIRMARETLIEAGFLMRIHKGGRGSGDPALFRLVSKGSGSLPNVTDTPLPLSRQGKC